MLRKNVGGRAVLDCTPILFIKLELHCRRFASSCNQEILFHKISMI